MILENGRTGTAVVGALRTRETTLGPAEGRAVHVEQSVLLLKTEPGLLVLRLVHDLLRVVTEVGPVGSAIVVVALRKDEDVVTAAEGVFENRGGAEVDIRVSSGGLVGGGTVKVPNPELIDARNLLRYGLKETESIKPVGGPYLDIAGGKRAARAAHRPANSQWSSSGAHRRHRSRHL